MRDVYTCWQSSLPDLFWVIYKLASPTHPSFISPSKFCQIVFVIPQIEYPMILSACLIIATLLALLWLFIAILQLLVWGLRILRVLVEGTSRWCRLFLGWSTHILRFLVRFLLVLVQHLQSFGSLDVNLGHILVWRLGISVWGSVSTIFRRCICSRCFPRFQPILIDLLHLLMHMLRSVIWWTSLAYSLRKDCLRATPAVHKHRLLDVFWVWIVLGCCSSLLRRIHARNCLIWGTWRRNSLLV